MLLMLVGLAGSLVARAPSVSADRCVRYARDTVVVHGRVERRVYPGRPNYESVPAGDHPDTVYVLRLTTPLCLIASADGEARPNVSEVQLYVSAGDERAVNAMRGKEATLRGTLEEWTVGWQHLPVLLHVHLPEARASSRREQP